MSLESSTAKHAGVAAIALLKPPAPLATAIKLTAQSGHDVIMASRNLYSACEFVDESIAEIPVSLTTDVEISGEFCEKECARTAHDEDKASLAHFERAAEMFVKCFIETCSRLCNAAEEPRFSNTKPTIDAPSSMPNKMPGVYKNELIEC